MWKKHISLQGARTLSKKFCKDFKLDYCEIYFVDTLKDEDGSTHWGEYLDKSPARILILNTWQVSNRIGILVHELTHHLAEEYNMPFEPIHGYAYQLAKKRVERWCKKNISRKANWKLPLRAYQEQEDMLFFEL